MVVADRAVRHGDIGLINVQGADTVIGTGAGVAADFAVGHGGFALAAVQQPTFVCVGVVAVQIDRHIKALGVVQHLDVFQRMLNRLIVTICVFQDTAVQQDHVGLTLGILDGNVVHG